jgi:hypothetical protein
MLISNRREKCEKIDLVKVIDHWSVEKLEFSHFWQITFWCLIFSEYSTDLKSAYFFIPVCKKIIYEILRWLSTGTGTQQSNIVNLWVQIRQKWLILLKNFLTNS